MFGANAVKPIETILFRDIIFKSFSTLFYQKLDSRDINRGPAVSENKHKRPTPKHQKKHLKTQVRSNCRNYSFTIVKLCFWTSGGTLKPVRGAAAKS